MAADRPKDWGETEFRYWYTGHIHRRSIDEISGGVTVETFRTLAPKDAWSASKGYRSGRDLNAIWLDKDFGEVLRTRVGIESIRRKCD